MWNGSILGCVPASPVGSDVVPIGPLIRRAFGPYEGAAAEGFRRIFVDLEDFIARLQEWVPNPGLILEVGCGEGAIAERLAKAYPASAILGSDICPTVGRLF